jgi:hypothetical protein
VIARSNLTRLVAALALGAFAIVPGLGRAEGLLDHELVLALADPAATTPVSPGQPDLTVPAAAAQPAKKAQAPGSLDFDLLGDAPKPAVAIEDPSLRTRRKMLNLHQGLGLGLLGLQLASTVTGQLNYNDKFGTANTARYKQTHQLLTYTNLATFAVVGGIALFAPGDKHAPPSGYGRTTIHKVAMGLATAGMVAQGLLGIQTSRREGYLDKQDYGRAHLVIGYATFAAMAVGVGAIVF